MLRFMIATMAYYQCPADGQIYEISSLNSDICLVSHEDEDNYYGNWVNGRGIPNVRFPKSSTRELSDRDKDRFNGGQISINRRIIGTVSVLKDGLVDETLL